MGSMDWYSSYKNKVSVNNTQNTIRDANISSFIDKIKNSFKESLSYFQVTKNNDLVTLYDCWIQEVKDTALKDGIDKKNIILYPGQTLNWGDYINWTDQNEIFLVMEKNVSPYYDNGKMERCHNNLKFKNSSGITVSYPCVITMESQTRYLDVQNNKDFIIPKNILLVSVQNNTDTKQIVESMRFILNNEAYKAMAKADTVLQGVIQIKLQSDLFRTGLDNVSSNGLADQSIQQTITPTTLAIQCSNSNNKIIINNQATLNIINNTVGEIFTWQILDAITNLSTINASFVGIPSALSCIIKANVSAKQIKVVATDSVTSTITTNIIISLSAGF